MGAQWCMVTAEACRAELRCDPALRAASPPGASAYPAWPTQVVNVSSIMHRVGWVGEVGRFLPSWRPGSYYPATKLANALFAFELQRRLGAAGIQVGGSGRGLLPALTAAAPSWLLPAGRRSCSRLLRPWGTAPNLLLASSPPLTELRSGPRRRGVQNLGQVDLRPAAPQVSEQQQRRQQHASRPSAAGRRARPPPCKPTACHCSTLWLL